jgi:sRNA-binding regulator protein Hfq
VDGELLDIDKNRISLSVKGQKICYYKHAIKGYYCRG